MTMTPAYRTRLKNEYEKAMDLNRKANGLIILKPAPGQTAPYVEKYLATFNFPTWVKAGSQIKKQKIGRAHV